MSDMSADKVLSGPTKARKAAFDVLMRVERVKGYANIELDEKLKASSLADADKRLAARLVYGTLEHRIRIDYILSRFSKIPVEKMSDAVRCALRMGVYQLLELDKVPDSAVCNEAVKLVKSSGSQFAAGFVNAVLRNIVRSRDNLPLPDKEKDFDAYLSVKYSCPKWILSMWRRQYGDVENLAAASLRNDYIALKINTLKISADDYIAALQDKGIKAEKGRLCSDAVLVADVGDMRSLYGYDEGYFFVEDEASQLCVKVLRPKPGETIFDMCSAPGGKSFAIAIEMADKGKIMSFDIHKSRLKLVGDGAKRLGFGLIETRVGDAAEANPQLINKADRVLCDVPCSGLGIMRKKPDIKLKTPEEIEALPEIQLKILNNCSQYVKKGGVLVYSTCTLNKKENEEVVHRFLEQNTGMKLTGFADAVPDMLKDDASRGYVTLMPHKHGCDGFFIARFVNAE